MGDTIQLKDNIFIIKRIDSNQGWDHNLNIDVVNQQTSIKTNINIGKKIFLVLLFSILASGINPAGFEAWSTMFGFVGNDFMMSRMYEARSPDFHQSDFFVLWK